MLNELCKRARNASVTLGIADTELRNKALKAMADALVSRSDEIIKANGLDLENDTQQNQARPKNSSSARTKRISISRVI